MQPNSPPTLSPSLSSIARLSMTLYNDKAFFSMKRCMSSLRSIRPRRLSSTTLSSYHQTPRHAHASSISPIHSALHHSTNLHRSNCIQCLMPASISLRSPASLLTVLQCPPASRQSSISSAQPHITSPTSCGPSQHTNTTPQQLATTDCSISLWGAMG